VEWGIDTISRMNWKPRQDVIIAKRIESIISARFAVNQEYSEFILNAQRFFNNVISRKAKMLSKKFVAINEVGDHIDLNSDNINDAYEELISYLETYYDDYDEYNEWQITLVVMQ